MKNSVLVMMAVLPLTLLLTGLNGCAGEGQYEAMPFPEPVPTPMSPEMEKSGAPGEDSSREGDVTIPTERMIVRNGDISLVVEDVDNARDEIEQLAAGLGGWVVNSNIYGEEEEMRGWISIRIPSDSLGSCRFSSHQLGE